MSKKKIGLLTALIFVLMLLAIPAYVVWIVFIQHTYDPGASATAADVTAITFVPPPPEAKDIRVATISYGQARATFVRFTAPVDVCEKYAAAVMPKTPLATITEDQQYSDSMTIYMNATRLSDLRWFDLPYANAFWTAGPGRPTFARPDYMQLKKTPEILAADENWELKGYLVTSERVDTARGVFYFEQGN